ncbi:flagellar hook-length control protein FliK [Paraburkholderia sp. B3]|uniref:flagellar hook-length control protein FliK n=1 Tax=Paraburkholderia sp. B3 TaxID=3134791 RepID=UPI00398223A2
MNGIDTGSAALLAGGVSGLSPVGSQGSAGAAQTGVSALATGGAAALADSQTGTAPQASALTVLSAVALALDAIIRSGGEATPAVVGEAPVWSDPDAATPGDASLPLPGMPATAAPAATGVTTGAAAADLAALEAALIADTDAALAQGAANPASAFTDSAATANAAAVALAAEDAAAAGQAAGAGATAQAAAAQSGPVAALAAALQQTVTGSGLFYESHLAQWLLGQRTPASLADEPQNRLVDASAQLPLDWALASDEADDVLWAEAGARDAMPGGARGDGTNASQAANLGPETGAALLASNPAGAAFVRTNGLLAEATLLPASQNEAQSQAVHAAVIPLVRQQLDLLATGEFRWTGEAWPGVRFDWSLQQERFDPRDGRHGAGGDPADAPWRTRLTLSLPTLGTVDAELTLAGEALAVRVQANPGGAVRLIAGGDALRGRLEALGLALTSLSIREVGGAPAPAEASKAASAYARAAAAAAAAAAQDAQVHAQAPTPAPDGAAADFDWEL